MTKSIGDQYLRHITTGIEPGEADDYRRVKEEVPWAKMRNDAHFCTAYAFRVDSQQLRDFVEDQDICHKFCVASIDDGPNGTMIRFNRILI
jgi:hypothetical protein